MPLERVETEHERPRKIHGPTYRDNYDRIFRKDTLKLNPEWVAAGGRQHQDIPDEHFVDRIFRKPQPFVLTDGIRAKKLSGEPLGGHKDFGDSQLGPVHTKEKGFLFDSTNPTT